MVRFYIAAFLLISCSKTESNSSSQPANPAPSVPAVSPAPPLVSAGAASAEASPTSQAPAAAPERLQAILECLIMNKKVLPYFHIDSVPHRKPLSLLKSPLFAAEPAITMFGMPARYVTAAEAAAGRLPVLEVTTWTAQADGAELAFRYPVEGLVGSARVRLSPAGCQVENLRLSER